MADPVSRILEHSVAIPGSEASRSAHPGSEVRDGTQTMLALGRPSARPGSLPTSIERFRAGYQGGTENAVSTPSGGPGRPRRAASHPSFRGERLAVPGQALRAEIVKEAHDPLDARHSGVTKTLDLVGRFCWWLGLQLQVRRCVKCCDVCQRDKAHTGIVPGDHKPLFHPR